MKEVIKIIPKYRADKKNKEKQKLKRSRKKKTHEEYIEEVKIKNPNVTVLGTYIGAREKILHKCNICGKEWYATPTNILKGHGCKSCSLKEAFKNNPKTQITLRKSHEPYVEELYNSNPNIEILDKYVTTEHKNHFRCKICGYEWYGKPGGYLRGKGCYKCGKKKMGEKLKYTHKEFTKKLNEVNKNIEVLSEYIDSKTKIACRCKIDNNEFYAIPSSLLAGHGCPECYRRKQILEENDFLKRINEQNLNIEILTPYTKAISDYQCRCKTCGHIWYANGCNIIQGRVGCRECYRRNKTLTHEEFVKEISEINSDIEIIGKYIKSTIPIKCKCKVCGHIWETNPRNLHYTGCPACKSSRGERLIKTFLNNNKILFHYQKKYKTLLGVNGKKLSYDFYLPQYNLLIEFQGKQHEQPIEYFGGEEKFKTQQEHDKRKREYAKLHNINLLEIWHYDINNIEKILTETLNNLKLKTVETTGIA